MESIATTADLKNMILLLETKQKASGTELKKLFFIAYLRLRPDSVLANVLKTVFPSTNLVDNIVIGGLSLASGYLVRKVVAGKSAGLLQKLAGIALQAGTSSLVARNAYVIKAMGQILYGFFATKARGK
jgi:hypothetical protein